MSEPGLELEQRRSGLWAEASGWRNLTLGAAALTALAVALPLALPDRPDTPAPGAGHPAEPPRALPSPKAQQPVANETKPAPPPQVVYVTKYLPAPSPITAPAAPAASSSSQACHIRLSETFRDLGQGVVTRFMPGDMVKDNIQRMDGAAEGMLDPAYAGMPVVSVHMNSGANYAGRLPPGVNARVGDRVSMQGWHRNVALPCNYVPDMVTADLGPAPAPTLPAAAPQPLIQASAPDRPGQTGSAGGTCEVPLPRAPWSIGVGPVTQIMNEAQVRENISQVQAELRGLIDPAHARETMISVLIGGHSVIGRVPAGMTVHVGDQVELQGRYRNMALPCHYVPDMVTADLGPAPGKSPP